MNRRALLLKCVRLNFGERAAEGRTARAEKWRERGGPVRPGNAALEILPLATKRAALPELELSCEKRALL